MPAMEPLCHLFGINSSRLTRQENLFLESILFFHLYEALKEFFKKQYEGYFRLLKSDIEKEGRMFEKYLIILMIKDILATEEYTLEGVARYADVPEDFIQEFFIGRAIYPTVPFFRKLVELHKNVKPAFYQEIVKKINSHSPSIL